MYIFVSVHPGSKRNLVKKEQDLFGQDVYHVYTSAKPIDGEANQAVLTLMAEYLGIKKYQIVLVSGEKSRHKKLETLT